jgi:hypothetical protein
VQGNGGSPTGRSGEFAVAVPRPADIQRFGRILFHPDFFAGDLDKHVDQLMQGGGLGGAQVEDAAQVLPDLAEKIPPKTLPSVTSG